MSMKTLTASVSFAALLLATPAMADLLSQSAMPAPEPVLTPNSAVPQLDSLKKYYPISDFRVGGSYDLSADPETWRNGGEGGTTLESLGAAPLRTAYIDMGTPQYNENGEIINAVVINSYYSGDATNMYSFWTPGIGNNGLAGGDPIVGPGAEIDTNKYYVVMLDALGLWGTSKPSDGLGPDFPQYNYMDMVQANYQLLRDHLNVANVHLVTGVSMGATQTWVWGAMYSPSGFVDAIMPIGGATASDGDDPVGQWTYRLATAAIESDPIWRETGARYYDRPKEEHPLQGLQFMWSILSSTGFDFAFRSGQDWDGGVAKEVFYWEPEGEQTAAYIGRTQNEDPLDFWYRNMGGFTYNINDQLENITARTLVIHVDNDNWLIVDNAKNAAAKVEGAGFMSFPDPTAHYGVFKAPNKLSAEVKSFVDNTNLPGTAAPSSGGGAAPEKPAGFSK
ncbi:MAG: alpha/beta fold hydrolase [Mangrovicoccus sp.]|nr:alpha/beta fold hydrolase [Mangrovicoccus sp.]